MYTGPPPSPTVPPVADSPAPPSDGTPDPGPEETPPGSPVAAPSEPLADSLRAALPEPLPSPSLGVGPSLGTDSTPPPKGTSLWASPPPPQATKLTSTHPATAATRRTPRNLNIENLLTFRDRPGPAHPGPGPNLTPPTRCFHAASTAPYQRHSHLQTPAGPTLRKPPDQSRDDPQHQDPSSHRPTLAPNNH